MDKLMKHCYEEVGAIVEGKTSIRFYPLNCSVNDILALSGLMGYKIAEFTEHNKPNFYEVGYKSGYVWVYSPNEPDGSFHNAEYTRKWRYIHELAHARTYELTLDRYKIESIVRGEGKMSLRDAIIAMDWELETMKLQFNYVENLTGVKLPEEAKIMEVNTMIADLTYRCISGQFSNPDIEGFVPSLIKFDLEDVENFLKFYLR